ncbi:hypothetical protein KKB83_03105 [Patescibacteria group bacterium]|nr:hypothetical protein [Patescibacteria group bacterium]
MELRRTTVRLPPTIYRQAKIKAAQEDITLQELVILSLQRRLADDMSKPREEKVKLKTYSLGKIKTKVDREAIYRDVDFLPLN